MPRKKLIFTNWKARPSGVYHLLTSLPGATEKQLGRLEYLEGRPNPTSNQRSEMIELRAKRDFKETPETLPQGVKTYLDEVFRNKYWGRRRLLSNKFLEKGNLCEQDVLEIHSLIDNEFYAKNDEFFSNDWIEGTPDNVTDDMIRDAKANWDFDSFDKAELTSLYEWQIKAYCWLTGKTKGELMYGLVNNPAHQILAARQSLWYSMGQPEEDDSDWRKAVEQNERNMIFDVYKFRDEHIGYDFDNPILDFHMPYYFRAKKFPVKLERGDISIMKNRISLCRKYLVAKEKEAEALKKLHKSETK